MDGTVESVASTLKWNYHPEDQNAVQEIRLQLADELDRSEEKKAVDRKAYADDFFPLSQDHCGKPNGEEILGEMASHLDQIAGNRLYKYSHFLSHFGVLRDHTIFSSHFQL